jgi:lysozyme family protein
MRKLGMRESKTRSFEWAEDDLVCVLPDVGSFSELTWVKIYAEYLPAGLDYFVFDCALHVGDDVALIWLRHVLGFPQHAKMEPALIQVIKQTDVEVLISGIEMLWRRRLKSSPNWTDVGRKQTNHINRVRHRALKLMEEQELVAAG